MLAQIIFGVQLLGMALIFASDKINSFLRSINVHIPDEFWRFLSENRGVLLTSFFFIGNTFRNSLLSTGAFEVYYGNDVVFSKLASGRMPESLEEIFSGLEEAMRATSDTSM